MTTNEFDEFGPEEELSPLSEEKHSAKGNFVENMKEAWRTRPLFKLFVIMAGVVVAIVISLSFTSAPDGANDSRLVKAPELNEAPGGKASPYFIEQNKQAANQRADQAMRQGGSAIPTPVGQSVDIGDLDKKDPLIEFRAETERLKQELKQEQQHNSQQIQQIQQQVQQPQAFDDSLAQAMQRQLQVLSEGWSAQPMKLITGADKGNSVPALNMAGSANGSSLPNGLGGSSNGSSGFGFDTINGSANMQSQVQQNAAAVQAINQDKVVVPAGTVSYGQLITEANSDVPGTVLAQIVSGPFSGGKAVGAFTVNNDYISLTFSLVSYKGKDYAVNIVALNPNTTLAGMATEIDPRYITRVILPAAASFVSSFGSAMASTDTSTEVTNNAVITNSAKKGMKEGIYSGIGEAGSTISQFMKDQANNTKQLVRIAAGTPMGLFFTKTVRENTAQAAAGLGSGTATGGGMGMSGLLNNMTNQVGSYGPYGNSNSQTGNTNSNVRIYGPGNNTYNNNGTSTGVYSNQ